MSAATFANRSRTGPNPSNVNHGGGFTPSYTCHMAAMHWAFMDRGDTQAVANQRVTAVTLAQCPGCAPPGGNQHPHLSSHWYSTHYCAGAQRIPTRAALNGAVEVGDVLIVGVAIQVPVHSMVVVNKRSLGGHSWVCIRGFNNVGTLGTGPHLQYDAHDRDIDRAALWHGAGALQTFGNGPGNYLHRIPFVDFSNRAGVIRAHCFGAPIAYHGA